MVWIFIDVRTVSECLFFFGDEPSFGSLWCILRLILEQLIVSRRVICATWSQIIVAAVTDG